MANDYFEFKQFIVKQDKTTMKVGTDGVLLGAWAKILQHGNILDIGTGTGLISLMLAQRTEAIVYAIDIDENSANQAAENFAISKWNSRLFAKHIALQEFIRNNNLKFDSVVSNPPYFLNSLKSNNNNRNIARHTDLLPFEILVKCVSELLTEKGTFTVIIPHFHKNQFIKICSLNKLYSVRQTDVKTTAKKEPARVLLEFSKKIQPVEQKTLVIHNFENSEYTLEFKELTRNYYLNF